MDTTQPVGLKMIEPTESNGLEDAIDCFEESWSPRSGNHIKDFLTGFDARLANDPAAFTELARIDIELRHRQRLQVSLTDYFEQFEGLSTDEHFVAELAFEDYRSHFYSGVRPTPDRWKNLPAVTKLSWYKELTNSPPTLVNVAQQKTARSNGSEDNEASFFKAFGFDVVKQIVQGAFSRVYLAIQRDLANRYVVLKVVGNRVPESQRLASLQHTNIVPIYSFHRLYDRSVICMPYAGSVTLESFMQTAPKSAQRAGESLIATVQTQATDTINGLIASVAQPQETKPDRYSDTNEPWTFDFTIPKPLESLRHLNCSELGVWLASRLASALVHSHARGILHGDIKPGNILIRNDGEPALLDFNLSQSLLIQEKQSSGGTLAYMSPEAYQAFMGQPVTVAQQSDLYSLGIVIFQFLTGNLPYRIPPSIASVDLELAIEERKKAPNWPNDSSIPVGVKRIVTRAISFDLQERYASANELLEDLDRERNSLSLVHADEPFTNRIRKGVRRYPRVVSGATVGLPLIILLLPAFFYWITWRNHALSSNASIHFKQFEDESLEAMVAWYVDPQRDSKPQVDRLFQVIDKYKIFDSDDVRKRLNALPEEEQLNRAQTIYRFIIQAGLAESRRLRILNKQYGLKADDPDRLTRAIDAAEKNAVSMPTRSLTFLKSQRAELSNDVAEAKKLREAADAINVEGDVERFLEATRLIINRRWREASSYLMSIIDRQGIPSSLRWTMLGTSQYANGEYENAKVSYTQAIERSPDSAALNLLRGHCYRQLGNVVQAEKDFSRAIAIDDTMASAWYGRAIIRLSSGRAGEALNDLNQGLRNSPGETSLLLLRSRAFKQLGRTVESRNDFDKAMAASNLNADALLLRAMACKALQPETALTDLQKASTADPDNPIILLNIANIQSVKLKRYDEAIATLDQALSIDPTSERAFADRAVLCALLGNHRQAADDAAKALATPNAPRTLYQVACAYALSPNESRRLEALPLLAQAIRAGYQADNLMTDPDLASLRKLPAFNAINRTYLLSRSIEPGTDTTLDPTGL